jgi:hypothetical protein
VVGQMNVAPSEYWGMCPAEIWLLVDARTPEKKYGNLRESEVDELAALHEQLEARK